MKLAIILDPLESIKTYKDSTYAVMRAAAGRGHALYVMEQQDVILRDGAVAAFARKLDLIDDALRWYTLETPAWRTLSDFDVTLMRKDPPFDMEYLYSTYLLELAEAQGARIFNRPAAIRDFNEKLSTYLHQYVQGGIERLKELHFHQPCSAMTPHRTTIEAYFREHPPATAKEAAAKITELTGITRSANRTRIFLKKCGMRWRVTGVLPAKADPVKQEEFKKNAGAPAGRSPSRETCGIFC